MSKFSDILKNIFTLAPDDDDEELENSLSNDAETISLPSNSSNPPSHTPKPLIKKKSHSLTSPLAKGDTLQIDCISIPKDESEAVHLAKLTIDKLQGGHPVIASASEVIRDGKYYHMIFGACYALECKIEKITPYSFLFLPRQFNVNSLNKKELVSHLPDTSFLEEDSSIL